VVVYGTASGLMQDETYTNNAGEFVLRLPKPAEYYIVATKDTLSSRYDLGYQPGMAIPPIDIITSGPRASIAEKLAAIPGIQSILGFLFGLLSGPLVAVWKQRYDNRRLFKVLLGKLGVLCGQLSEKRAEISELNALQKPLPPNDPRTELKRKFQPLHHSVASLVDQLERVKPDDAVVYAWRREQGYDNLLAFEEATSNLKDMINGQPPLPENWDDLLVQMDDLQNAIAGLAVPTARWNCSLSAIFRCVTKPFVKSPS
jgi:hypothetical protein